MDNFQAHILVVDDDEGIRSLVKKYLNEKKYLVTTANNAENASEKISIIKFDLIILDIMMPGKSGLDFLKENRENINTPIILLTAKGEPNERIEGLEMGADDYLPKPFIPLSRIKPLIASPCSFDFAQTTNTSAIGEFEIHILEPDKEYPPFTLLAVVFIELGSEPASGSVNPKHPISSPEASLGKYFCL